MTVRAFSKLLVLVLLSSKSWAFSWQDLWVTKNRQGQTLMDAGQFSAAQETFDDLAWQATAAYRAGDYKTAALGYQALKNNAESYYNQGNALAHAGQLDAAIKAYDQALFLSPSHQDALYNQKIVKDLLKKQDKQDQNKQDQNKQDQNKQDQNKQDQDKQDQDKQDQDKQDQDKQDQDKQDQDKQDQDKQDQDKQDQDKQDQDKQDQDKQDKPLEKPSASQADREKKQEKEQWLRLIPDDPGGLMREKFLRDYLSRHRHQGYE